MCVSWLAGGGGGGAWRIRIFVQFERVEAATKMRCCCRLCFHRCRCVPLPPLLLPLLLAPPCLLLLLVGGCVVLLAGKLAPKGTSLLHAAFHPSHPPAPPPPLLLAQALVDLQGRFFAGREVEASFFEEARFENKDLAPRPEEVRR